MPYHPSIFIYIYFITFKNLVYSYTYFITYFLKYIYVHLYYLIPHYYCTIQLLNCFITGKKIENLHGQKIKDFEIENRSWLYVNDHPVICNRHMEVSALVSSINPSVNQFTDLIEVATLQKILLWLLYDEGHLSRFPICLGNFIHLI